MKRIAMLAPALALAAGAAFADEITLWTPEEQPERLAVQEEIGKAFTEKTGHTVKIVPVSEKDLGTRMTAAFAGGELPDVVYHSLQYVLPWAEAGILDTDAATEVVEALGAGTFATQPLAMASTGDGYATVPVDGWTQMVVYRKDLFEANGLAAPDNFATISKAIDTLHNPPEMYAFTAATKVDETYMMQVLEHVMLANGYSPVDGNNGDDAALREVLGLYKKMAKASPPGELYWKQSRELFFAGKTAMIIWSPFIMDELAGLRDSAPPTINDDPTSRELASKTGFVTRVAGPGNPGGAGWADIRYMGVTNDAETDAAMAFVQYVLSEGYGKMLSMAPEGKFPVRRGDASDPEKFINVWAGLPVGVDRKAPLGEIYPKDVVDGIVAGLANGNRWGVGENQLSRASKIISSLMYNRVVRQFIDDEISMEDAVKEVRSQLSAIE